MRQIVGWVVIGMAWACVIVLGAKVDVTGIIFLGALLISGAILASK